MCLAPVVVLSCWRSDYSLNLFWAWSRRVRFAQVPKMQHDTVNFGELSTVLNAEVWRSDTEKTSPATVAAPNFSDYINLNNPVSHSNSVRWGCTAFHRSSLRLFYLSILLLTHPSLRIFSLHLTVPSSSSVWRTNSRNACVVSRTHDGPLFHVDPEIREHPTGGSFAYSFSSQPTRWFPDILPKWHVR